MIHVQEYCRKSSTCFGGITLPTKNCTAPSHGSPSSSSPDRASMRHDEVASNMLLWKPNGPRIRGRSNTTVCDIMVKDTRLGGTNLLKVTTKCNQWTEFIVSLC